MQDTLTAKKPATAALPAACKGVDPCSDVACQQAIAVMHVITEAEFQSRILPDGGAPKVMTGADVQGIVDGGDCSKQGLLFDQTVPNNADLNPIAAAYNPAFVVYSLPFFKGILSESPDTFSFYLASGGSTGTDVIFSVTFAAQPDRFYDGSQLWPSL